MTDAAAGRPAVPMEPLMELIGGALAFTVLRAAVEVGVFDHLAEGISDAASIAREVKADERGTRLLLDALTAMGILESGDGYRLSPLADATLVSGQPGYFGDLVAWMADLLHQAGPHMADAVRRGGTVLEEDVLAQLGLWEEFAGASAAMAGVYAEALADIMAPFLAGRPGAIDILDVACGSGLYGLTLAGRHPAARVTLNDWAEVLERTRATVDRLGLADRSAFLAGDVFEAPLGGPYDVIVASNFFHALSEEQSRELLLRLAAVLRPDARLAIQGPMAAGSPAEDRFPRLFSMLLLTVTPGGQAHAVATYERLFADAGLTLVEVHDLPGINGVRSVIAARRP
jgi:SAM-dependent methyltransferase